MSIPYLTEGSLIKFNDYPSNVYQTGGCHISGGETVRVVKIDCKANVTTTTSNNYGYIEHDSHCNGIIITLYVLKPDGTMTSITTDNISNLNATIYPPTDTSEVLYNG